MSPTAALPLAQAQSYTRFGNGAKKSFAKRGDQPRSVAAENTQEDTEADEDAEYRHCEPHSTGLRRPPRFPTMSFFSKQGVTRNPDLLNGLVWSNFKLKTTKLTRLLSESDVYLP